MQKELLNALKKNATAKQKLVNAVLELETSMKNSMSLVHIYFKELGIVKYSREELYSIMDVIGKPFRMMNFCTLHI